MADGFCTHSWTKAATTLCSWRISVKTGPSSAPCKTVPCLASCERKRQQPVLLRLCIYLSNESLLIWYWVSLDLLSCSPGFKLSRSLKTVSTVSLQVLPIGKTVET